MPHIKVDVSANAARPGRIKPFLSDLAARLADFESIESGAVKAYLNVREHFAMNPDGRPAFIHVEVALMRGRNLELRSQIADAMREIVIAEFAEKVSHDGIAITVEIREMDAETYRR
jgi:5-carboxymethyl-2-hydroxymuconate isomerase